MSRTIVLAGAGHAHLYTLKRTGELVRRGFEVVLINPGRFLHYSGMAPGNISGLYRPDEARIDVARLVERGGGEFVDGRVEEIRASENTLVLEDGYELRYDTLSTCLGSEVSGDPAPDAVTVKPVQNLTSFGKELRERLSDEERPRVLISGGGAAGCEVACNTAKVFEDHRISPEIILVEASDSILDSYPEKAQSLMRDLLVRRGVRIRTGTKVLDTKDGVALTSRGGSISFDRLVLAVGISPSDVYRKSGLLTSEDGGLWTNEALQSVTSRNVFGGGDGISFRGESLPRLGVFAVRQAPVLYRNIQAFLTGRPMRRYVPQSRYLSILNCGNGEGIAVRGEFVWKGRLPWLLKNAIDRSFVRGYR